MTAAAGAAGGGPEDGGEGGPPQRQHPKRWSVTSNGGAREQRRKDALKRQREARREITDRVRALVLEAMHKEPEEEEEEEGQQQQQQQGEQQQEQQAAAAMEEAEVDDVGMAQDALHQQLAPQQGMVVGRMGKQRQQQPWRRPVDLQRAAFFASQFAIPEWLVGEPPPDLNGKDSEDGGGWFVMARPEGKRCFLVASGGMTVSRLLNGEVLHRFESALPNGGANSPGPQNGYTCVDCIYHEIDRTYYMLDLLCWRSMELLDSTAEFRLFFLRSKFEEELEPRGAALCADAGAPDPWPYRMRPLLYHDCDAPGLRRAYQGFTPFVRDGLLLLHKQGFYDAGLTPLALLWKDASTSRYLTAQALSCVLAVRRRGRQGQQGHEYELATMEGLVVGSATAAEVEGAWGLFPLVAGQQHEQEKGEGERELRLARFRYEAAGEVEGPITMASSSSSSCCVVEGLRFEKPCSASRAVADPWSKILFNSRVRGQGQGQGQGGAVSFEDLLAAAEGGSDSSMLS